MEEFNLHRVNPEIQQFYYCYNIHSQVELDNLLTDLIHTCGYQNYLQQQARFAYLDFSIQILRYCQQFSIESRFKVI